MCFRANFFVLLLFLTMNDAFAVDCLGKLRENIGGASQLMLLDDGGVMAFSGIRTVLLAVRSEDSQRSVGETHQGPSVDNSNVYAAAAPDGIRNHAPVGSYGVAIDRKKQVAVPFVVADTTSEFGEASGALAKRVRGVRKDADNFSNTQHQGNSVLWVFFGKKFGTATDIKYSEATNKTAAQAFKHWGGKARLSACLVRAPRI
ncbi:hypothetical protein P0D73_44995 [Paraburkholderia sp. RL18-101-BIB-B]|uniref:hypothetical protein n=1 Tax=Paraburkholderia sp. RL18-101-BIB-B TaxID=3031634 RepID=UPI0038BCC531